MLPSQKMLAVILAILIVLSSLSYHPTLTFASTELVFIVDSTADLPDFATNSVCSAGQPTAGPCTLRAAISEANGNLNYAQITILVPPGYYALTLPPSSPDSNNDGDLDINATNSTNLITIKPTQKGAVVITSTMNDRILSVGWNASVLIQGISFVGARLAIDNIGTGGGAVLNSGKLTLEDTTFHDNSVTCAIGSTCTSNVIGGAILNFNTLAIIDSSFTQNSADRGFALFNAGGEVSCTIRNSSFSQNIGTYTGTITNYSNMSITNSTISGNISSMTSYAGIYNGSSNSLLALRSSTLANYGNFSSIINEGTANVSDSIFFAQPGLNNFYSGGGTVIWNSGGYNIFSDASWSGTLSTGDLTNTNPLLGTLGNYGGTTLTHSLPLNSPAVNHRPTTCLDISSPLITDQRHQPRVDGRCDTGAFELGSNYLPLIIK